MTRLDGEGVRVVLVGTGSHVSGSRLPDVAAIAATVGAVRSCLVEVCGVREQNLICLLDPAGPEPFLDAVIAAASAASDVLVVYFVGHGALDITGHLHLATRATVDLTSRAAYQALPYSEIVGALANCRARLVVVVLDCCYSGRATIPVRSGALLASADRDEQALAPVGEEHTAFSGALVAALNEGIPRAPAWVTLQHLHGHLARVMRRRNRTVPVLQTGNDAGELVLAANRADQSDTDEGLVTPWEGDCPYRGLESYTAEDEEVFHGRAELVSHVLARLGERVRSGGMTVIGGPSGSGKTSLLCAGILPAIAHGDLGVIGSSSWPQIIMTPGEDPLGALAAGLGQLGSGQDAASIRAALTGDPAVLRAVVRRARVEAMPPASDVGVGRLVIVVDQFEEVFAPGVSDSTRCAFIAALDTLAARTQSEDPSAVVILGLRSDFDGQCARFPELVTAVENHQVLVGPMTTAQLRSSIVEPARQARIELQPGLVELLLRDTGADPDDDQSADYDPGALPLLSHAVLTTWQHRRGNLLTVDGYREIGGVAGAISTTAEHTFTALDAEAQQAARRVLLRMVRVGEDTPDTRRRVNRKELFEAFPDPGAAARALEAFADARLVTVDRDTAEITHEALIRSWPRLKEWMTADRDGQLLAQEIEADAAGWNRGHQDTALLYRGSRLARALERAEAPHHGDLSALALDFLTASTNYARRATRRLQSVVVVLAVLLLVAVGAAGFAVRESLTAQAQRDQAIVNQVVSEAGEQSQVDQSLAAQLDLLAYRRLPTPELRMKLLAAQGSPLSQPLIGHTNSVESVAFSPDGHTLASGSTDHTVRLWNVADPAHPTTLGPPLSGHTNAVAAVAFSPDGRILASSSWDSTVLLWNVADPAHPTTLGQPLIGHTNAVDSVAFSPDGHTLASGSDDHTVRLWNVTDSAHPTTLGPPLTGHTYAVTSVAFSPDGHTLASGSTDHTVRLWNVADPAHLTTLAQPLTGHTNSVDSVAFSPDGHTLASGSADHTVRLWNVADPAHPTRLGQLIGHTNSVLSVAFSPDGRTLASGGDFTVRLWNVAKPAHPLTVGPPLIAGGSVVYAVKFGANGQTLATANGDGSIRWWDLPRTTLTGHINSVFSVMFSPDGHTLASGSADHTVRLWNVADPAHPTTLAQPLTGHTNWVTSVAFSPDGHTLASGGYDHTVRLWNVADPVHPTTLGPPLIGYTNSVLSVAFSPDGHTLASGSWDSTVRLWNVADPAHPTTLGPPLTGHTNAVSSVAFSPDGHTLASGSADNTVRLWNVTDPAHPTTLAQPLTGHTNSVTSVVFSPDGHTLASGSADHTVRLWNVTDPAHPTTLAQPLTGHTNSVSSVAFSPDGHTLASSSSDNTVRLWNVTDPAHPTTLGQLTGHTNGVFSVAFSPDGHTLASGSGDNTVRLWNLDVDSAINRICATTGKDLTPAQWQQYAPGLSPSPLC